MSLWHHVCVYVPQPYDQCEHYEIQEMYFEYVSFSRHVPSYDCGLYKLGISIALDLQRKYNDHPGQGGFAGLTLPEYLTALVGEPQ